MVWGCNRRQVDPDLVALAGEFERGGFGEEGDAALGQGIERVLRRPDEPGDRGQVDDGAAVRAEASRIAQGRQRELGAEKDAGQIDRAQALPFIEARPLDILAEKKPGVVDEDVELAEAREDCRDGSAPRFFAGHVEMQIKYVAPGAFQGTGGRAAALVEDIGNPDFGAGLDHQPGGLAADAARRAGDQRHLAVKPVHLSSSRTLLPRILR